jgi:hypothetical protein
MIALQRIKEITQRSLSKRLTARESINTVRTFYGFHSRNFWCNRCVLASSYLMEDILGHSLHLPIIPVKWSRTKMTPKTGRGPGVGHAHGKRCVRPQKVHEPSGFGL